MYELLGNKVSCVNNETAEIYKPRFSDAVTARMNTENKTVNNTFFRDYIFMYVTFKKNKQLSSYKLYLQKSLPT